MRGRGPPPRYDDRRGGGYRGFRGGSGYGGGGGFRGGRRDFNRGRGPYVPPRRTKYRVVVTGKLKAFSFSKTIYHVMLLTYSLFSLNFRSARFR